MTLPVGRVESARVPLAPHRNYRPFLFYYDKFVAPGSRAFSCRTRYLPQRIRTNKITIPVQSARLRCDAGPRTYADWSIFLFSAGTYAALEGSIGAGYCEGAECTRADLAGAIFRFHSTASRRLLAEAGIHSPESHRTGSCERNHSLEVVKRRFLFKDSAAANTCGYALPPGGP